MAVSPVSFARRLLAWIMRPPDFGALEWARVTHLGLDEEDEP